jgi:Phospholipase D Active site motif
MAWRQQFGSSTSAVCVASAGRERSIPRATSCGRREILTRQTRIRVERDPREHPFHCHHEKTVVIDGHVAFVGGIDMTDFGGDRNDSAIADRPPHAVIDELFTPIAAEQLERRRSISRPGGARRRATW